MTQTNVGGDLVRRAGGTCGLGPERDAVDPALGRSSVEPMTMSEALATQGSGWDGDLDEMRAGTRPRT